MAVRNTLFAKILAWFFLNLVLIAVAVWAVSEFQIGPASPFLGQSEDRVRRAAMAISSDLMDAPRAEWPGVLRDHENRFGNQVTFHLVGVDRKSLTDNEVAFPEQVLEQVRVRLDQDSFSRRLVENRYQELNATQEQKSNIIVSWREYIQARGLLSAELRQLNLDPGDYREQHTARRQVLEKELQDKIREVLNERQVALFERMLERERRRWPLQTRLIIPTNEQEFSADFAAADIDKDGMLDHEESRRFIEEFSRPIPRDRRFRRPSPNGNDRPGRVTGTPPPPSENNNSAPPSRSGQRVFTLTTKDPVRYWAGLEIPVRSLDFNSTFSSEEPVEDVSGLRVEFRPRERRNQFFATLVFESESLGAGGLFSDPLPWVPIVIIAIVLSALFWLPMVRNITRPMAEVTAATEQIAKGRFDARVGTARSDEIGRVGQAVDHMADRLAGFVKGQKRFLGDISHELCSPIARIQAALANLEQRADGKQKKYVADLTEEVQHMSELVDEILMFSKAGMKPADVNLEPVPLAEAAQRVIDREGAAAVELQVDIPENLKVNADLTLLSRALGNLLRNAVRYAGQAGPIQLRAKTSGGKVHLTLADQGPGLPAESLPYIFDPFFRPEQSRGRDTGGAGLGLSIVKSCLEACGGKVTCRNRKPNGLEFLIQLQPAARA